MPPFFAKNRNQLMDKIKFSQPELNKNWSKNLRDLIPKLLTKDPEERLKFASTIKEHPWLNQTNWKDLFDKKLKPPYVPIIKEDTDVSNFATEFTNLSPVSNNDTLRDCADYEGFSFERSPTASPLIKPCS